MAFPWYLCAVVFAEGGHFPKEPLGLEFLGAEQLSSPGALLLLGQHPGVPEPLCPMSTATYELQEISLHTPTFWQARGSRSSVGPPGEPQAGCTSSCSLFPQHLTGTVQRLQDLVTRS